MATPESHFKPKQCNVCGHHELKFLASRSDDVRVMACTRCDMGVIEHIPYDTSILYQDNYYGDASKFNTAGYSDYDTNAEHGVLWAAELLKLIRYSGKVLDVGCANGYLLSQLNEKFDKFGIEVNEVAANKAEKIGIKIIGNDVLNSALADNYANQFDAITAIAVFEHVVDFRGAIEATMKMLKPCGILIFEVPLVSENQPNDTWFSTSLEHIYYPSENGIRTLFDEQLKVPMIGVEFVIRDYASTFVGVAMGRDVDSEKVAEVFRRVFFGRLSELTLAERRVQLILNIVHGANSTTENIEYVSELIGAPHSTPFLSRFLSIWRSDVLRLSSKTAGLNEIELAKIWHSKNASNWEMAHLEIQMSYKVLERRLSETLLLQDALLRERTSLEEVLSDSALRLTDEKSKHVTTLNELHQVYRSKSWQVTKSLRVMLATTLSAKRYLNRHLSVFPSIFTKNRIQTGLLLLRNRDLSTLKAAITHVSQESIKEVRRHSIAEVISVPPLPFGAPIVSVVIPCFNYGRFVEAAIDSILAQTLQNIEIIVVDGGSTDGNTIESLKALQKSGKPKTKILFRTGRHLVGDNRNYGIELAKGRYICCLDADDTVDPTYLEKAIFHLETYGYDIVSTAIRFVGAKSGTVDILEYPDFNDMTDANHVLTCAVFRRNLWLSTGGYFDVGLGKDHVAEDWDFWLRLAATGARIRNLSREYLFNYRTHTEGSLSTSADIKDLESQKLEILKRNKNIITPAAIKTSQEQQARYLLSDPSKTALALGERLITGSSLNDLQKSLILTLPFTLIGGAERLLSGLCSHLTNNGWRVTVVTTLNQDAKFGSSLDWFKRYTNEVFSLPTFLADGEKKDFLQYLISSRQPNCLLNAGSLIAYEQLPAIRQINPKMAVVDLLFNCIGHTGSHLEFKQYISYALAENLEVMDWLERTAGWPKTHINVLSSGVDLEDLRPEPRSTKLVEKHAVLPHEIVIGFSGRLSLEKAPELFLKIAMLCENIPNLRFFMTGAGPLTDEIIQAAALLPKSARLEFVGLVDDVYEYLHLYDILILPSLFDGRPIVVLEALACGVPVIASNIGGLPSLIDEGQNGYLVPVGDVQGFVDRISIVQKDASLLTRLKLNARRTAEDRLDSNKAYEAYESALNKAIGLHLQQNSSLSSEANFN
jgi:O-antigen biosynthesis protein